jgi:hypothetical protein
MDKRLTAKRLLKRHNRHASSALNWVKSSKPDLRAPARIRTAGVVRHHPAADETSRF